MPIFFPGLARAYGQALREFLASADASPAYAHGVAVRAREAGATAAHLAKIQHRVLGRALRLLKTPDEIRNTIDAAQRFFVEVMFWFGEECKGLPEEACVVQRINQRLEHETRRIAHALHDEAGQILASMHILLEDRARSMPCHTCGHLHGLLAGLDQVEEQIRSLARELRPRVLDDLGLIPALESLADAVGRRKRIRITVESNLAERLPEEVETALYRVSQEALTNAGRHAGAKNVRITVTSRLSWVRCVIADDGRGFDASRALAPGGGTGMGLVGMQDRARALNGSVQINSGEGQGTEIVVEIPLEKAGDVMRRRQSDLVQLS